MTMLRLNRLLLQTGLTRAADFFGRRLPDVTCLDCGFLAFGKGEASSGDREMLASKGSNAKMPVLDSLRCYRSLWASYEVNYCGNPAGPKLEEVNERRRCEGFLQYKPGFSPEEHKQRLAKSEERK